MGFLRVLAIIRQIRRTDNSLRKFERNSSDMKKIGSLFKRDYHGDRLVYNEIVFGAEWVQGGEGRATVKWDGSCCLIEGDKLYKRYDRRISKTKARLLIDKLYVPQIEDYKAAPKGWLAAESEPDRHTGHWPGWVAVGDGPEDQWHREAFERCPDQAEGTYELVGPKVQSNPYGLTEHMLTKHGDFLPYYLPKEPPRTFNGLKEFFRTANVEGIVWHHPDGRMVKIKRRDFGYPWPAKNYLNLRGALRTQANT